MIQIKLNGKQYKLRSGITLIDLLNAHNINNDHVAIELNEEIITQERFS